MIALGYRDSDEDNNGIADERVFATIVNLDSNHSLCSKLRLSDIGDFKHPVPIDGSTGGLLFGMVPFFCGGGPAFPDPKVYSTCFTAVTQHHAQIIIEMPEPRIHAASIVTGLQDSTLFVVGGSKSRSPYIYLKSTLYIRPFGNLTNAGPDMPDERYQHCFIKVGHDRAIVTGGSSGWLALTATYFYNTTSRQWSVGPESIKGRGGAACNAVKDSVNPNKTMVVEVGGWPQTVGILDLETNIWKEDLTALDDYQINDNARIVATSQQELLLVGLYKFYPWYSDIASEVFGFAYRIRCFNGDCVYVNVRFEADFDQTGFQAMLIPDHLVNCKWSDDGVDPKNKCLEENKNLLANGVCDDDLDHPGCFYDGGDCS